MEGMVSQSGRPSKPRPRIDAPTEDSHRIASKVIEPPHAGTDTVSKGNSERDHSRVSLKVRLVSRSWRLRTSNRSPCFKSKDFMATPGLGSLSFARDFG